MDAQKPLRKTKGFLYGSVKGKNKECDVDIIVRKSGGKVVMAFRDNGAACDYLKTDQSPEEGMALSGIGLLKRMADEVKYDYVMGFNCMRVVIPECLS